MSIKVTKGSSAPAVEAGLYPARLVSVIHLGHIEGYQGAISDQVRFTFEIPSEVNAEGKPALISKESTLTFTDRSFITKLAKAVGIDTETQDLDLTDLLGKTCMVNLEEKTAKASGNKYVKVETVAPLAKGMEVEAQINESFWYSVAEHDQEKFDSMPDFLQDKIKTSEELNPRDPNEKSF
jgi:hypothetical protein